MSMRVLGEQISVMHVQKWLSAGVKRYELVASQGGNVSQLAKCSLFFLAQLDCGQNYLIRLRWGR